MAHEYFANLSALEPLNDCYDPDDPHYGDVESPCFHSLEPDLSSAERVERLRRIGGYNEFVYDAEGNCTIFCKEFRLPNT